MYNCNSTQLVQEIYLGLEAIDFCNMRNVERNAIAINVRKKLNTNSGL